MYIYRLLAQFGIVHQRIARRMRAANSCADYDPHTTGFHCHGLAWA